MRVTVHAIERVGAEDNMVAAILILSESLFGERSAERNRYLATLHASFYHIQPSNVASQAGEASYTCARVMLAWHERYNEHI